MKEKTAKIAYIVTCTVIIFKSVFIIGDETTGPKMNGTILATSKRRHRNFVNPE